MKAASDNFRLGFSALHPAEARRYFNEILARFREFYIPNSLGQTDARQLETYFKRFSLNSAAQTRIFPAHGELNSFTELVFYGFAAANRNRAKRIFVSMEPKKESLDSDCANCPIRYSAVCALCDAEELAVLERIKSMADYDANAKILCAGENMDFVGSVVSGIATISQTLDDGRRQIMGLLLPGDFLGRSDRRESTFDITAVSRLRICRFGRQEFGRLLNESPAIRRRLMEMSLDELDEARLWMLVLGRKTSREKLASFFAFLVARQARVSGRFAPQDEYFVLPMGRGNVADYLGLTLETVSRRISDFKQEGLIEMSSKRLVRIPDFDALLEESGDAANWRDKFFFRKSE